MEKRHRDQPPAKRQRQAAEFVPINVGTYTIHIGEGTVHAVPRRIIELCPATRYVMITDSNVEKLYSSLLVSGFHSSGHDLLVFAVPPGEASKSRQHKAEVEDWMLARGCTRDSCLIAFGGGVVGDLTGFVAATYMRGIPYVQVPTSLLAMVDSSIGGKTAIDVPAGKNLVGAFHNPRAVLVDLKFLSSLPLRHICNGLAEAIKTGVIRNTELFHFLEDNVEGILAGDLSLLGQVVYRSARIKAEVVVQDEEEHGLRALLNFGHSVGHAVEDLSQDQLPPMLHGEAVAIGMVQEAALARSFGFLPSSAIRRLKQVLQAYRLPVDLPDHLSIKMMLKKMGVDKKNKADTKRVVMLNGVGSCVESPYSTAVRDDQLATVLWQSASVMAGTARGNVAVPGSKSVSNRCLLLAAMGKGTCRITGLLHSDDTRVMLNALRAMSVCFHLQDNDQTVVIVGNEGEIKEPNAEVYLQNAGTASRFVTTLATTLKKGSVTLTGNKRMMQRPVGDLVAALRTNGSQIDYLGIEGSLPIRITGKGGLAGGEIRLAPTTSSQFVSSILLSAPMARSSVTLILDTTKGRVVSKPYIDMTLNLMATFGIIVQEPTPFTYVVPKGCYRNPEHFQVEGDASSATYPLALAAITGGTVTVTNVGSDSTQGDKDFCKLLARMGCDVQQTASATTVTGPKPELGLVAISDVDMDTMTDAFMTLVAVAAVSKGTTSIVNIANQRVKECNRIEAMVVELAKLGIVARERPTGIEVDGQPLLRLSTDTVVHCYDDHRIAMSFAVLSARIGSVIMDQKACVDKTYPAFWDDLQRNLSLKLKIPSFAPPNCSKNERSIPQDLLLAGVLAHRQSPQEAPSLVVIGMRGAGKTTLSLCAAECLGRPWVDVDQELEKNIGESIKQLVERDGWAAFRAKELQTLKDIMATRSRGHVIACGGGIVETPEALALLKAHALVVEVRRPLDEVIQCLEKDQQRPAFSEIRKVYATRAPLYQQAANFEFVSPASPKSRSLQVAKEQFVLFLKRIMGLSAVPQARPGSFFLSLTFKDLTQHETLLGEISPGVDALELRADLLQDQTPAAVQQQLAWLRAHTHLPIIFTVRSKGQGGGFPDHEERIFELLRCAVRMGCEYVDMESHWSETARFGLLKQRGVSRIIASHHIPEGNGGSEDDLRKLFHRVNHHGAADVVKVVVMASCFQDATRLMHVANTVQLPGNPRLIVLAMGEAGKISRVLNQVFSPVTHPALPTAAAPGQLSVVEIQAARSAMGLLPPRRFCIFGSPVAQSPSPCMHNSGFEWLALPHRYTRVDTQSLTDVKATIEAADFGGASVTIPLKEQVGQLCDRLSPAVKAIGAVNTLIRLEDGGLLGDNTDWLGIVHPLAQKLSTVTPSGVALVVGAGGTARAAIYALQQLGFKHIAVWNRSAQRARELAQHFACTAVQSTSHASLVEAFGPQMTVKVVLSTLPGSVGWLADEDVLKGKPVVFDVSYLPRDGTVLCKQATAHGCALVRGLDMLVAQGMCQFELWTGRTAAFPAMEKATRQEYNKQK